MSPPALSIGIAGAGLLGRLLAWQLSRRGHRVSVFDSAAGPQPVARSQAGDPYVPTAAGFTAAGMLSPLSELDNAEPAVAHMGFRSLALWPGILAALPGAPELVVRGSLLLAHRADLGTARRMLDRLHVATATPEWRHLQLPAVEQPLSPAELRTLEPAIQGPAHAWLLPGEGHIDTVATMIALHAGASGVDWHWGVPVRALQGGDAGGTLLLADGRALAFDAVVDVRGAGARPELPVRGVRGEVVWLDCPGHGLTRPARLLHPRHFVYMVPRSSRDVVVGASEIESEDRSPVSLRTAVELMAAAHSVLPGLAEARILKLDVNLRPALPDNNPLIEHAGRLLRINGLFRHGWLLAPALVERALAEAPWLDTALASDGRPSRHGAAKAQA
ncbi:MAG TPA: FAD-dependent oxidoreductase [Ottowia sp.]|nr:FAD-dependent oxidoreductase [Ottowia sp.]HNJ45671.1 FAD-dependent oxidoreductase [Ottowia sp.]HNL41433.1 FAD-dependent oxidoreductase [Ottowia sp.]HNN33634.1 FAD-dependent oxidoreductase [Ottowia sp.]